MSAEPKIKNEADARPAAAAAAAAHVPREPLTDEQLLAMAIPYDPMAARKRQEAEKANMNNAGVFRVFTKMPATAKDANKKNLSPSFWDVIAKYKMETFNLSSLYVTVQDNQVKVTSAWDMKSVVLTPYDYLTLASQCLIPHSGSAGYDDQPIKSASYLMELMEADKKVKIEEADKPASKAGNAADASAAAGGGDGGDHDAAASASNKPKRKRARK